MVVKLVTSSNPVTDNSSTLFFSMSAEETLKILGTSLDGLSTEQVTQRKALYGDNTLPEKPADTLITVIARQFLSPLIYVLFVASVVSLFLKEWSDAAFIFAVLIINSIIGTIQEYHAQRSAEALKKMISTRSEVLRNNESCEINASELVPGDIVIMSAGTRVPADIRLFSGYNLETDESLLTGESTPVTKQPDTVLPPETLVSDRINMVFAGSIVNSGKAIGVVTHTGVNTMIGQLAISLQEEKSARPPLMVRLDRFTTRVAISLGIVVVVISIIELSQGTPWQQVFLIAVALAVSAIPEGLPVAVTVALAISMHRMARRNVIVRKLVAVEALGSCTYIASDKTGTLTMNELTVQKILIPGSAPLMVTGTGMVPEGVVEISGELELQSSTKILQDIFLTSVLCNEGFLGKRNGLWSYHGDTVDLALLVMAHKAGYIQAESLIQYPLIDQIPYESERGFAASLHRYQDHTRIFVKGSLEKLLKMCDSMSTLEGTVPINQEFLLSENQSLAREGFRVIALASGAPSETLQDSLAYEHLQQLTLHALIAIHDPLRPESKEAIQACRRAGIHVSMVTGDHPATAFAIARELGLASHDYQVATGSQVNDAEQQGMEKLVELVANTHVFARVEPKQKLSIVHALQQMGHYVAMTGDGANDAPALKAAEVGVAMGKRGSDVARESADLIVSDDHFESIVSGIEEGRIAYQNIRKVIFLLISTGAAEVVLFILTLLSGLPLPLLPAQLLWLNLVTNGIQDVALAFDPREGSEMSHPPRKPGEAIFNRIMIERVLLTAVTMGGISFLIFEYLIMSGMGIDQARNLTLLLLVLFENIHVFNSRSETRSVFSMNLFSNRILLIGTIVAQLIHIIAMYIPLLQQVLGVSPVSLSQWSEMLGLAMVILLIMELHKWVRRKLLIA